MLDLISKFIKKTKKIKWQLSFKNKDIRHQELIYITKPIPVLVFKPGFNKHGEKINKIETIFERGSILSIKKKSTLEDPDLPIELIKVGKIKTGNSFDFLYYREDREWYDDTQYYVNVEFLKEYGIYCGGDLNVHFGPAGGTQLNLNLYEIDFYKAKTSKMIKIFMNLIDIFKNFEPEITNQFAPGIYDTLHHFHQLLKNKHTNTDLIIDETCEYMEDVYNTILSFGENIKCFPTPCELVDKKEYEEELAIKEREQRLKEEQEKNKQQQEEFLNKMKYRRQLLADFNEPLENIPKKLQQKYYEIDTKWIKEK